eukprot:Gb_15982 [translate_table: standard]
MRTMVAIRTHCLSFPSFILVLCTLVFASAQTDHDSHTTFIFNKFNHTSKLNLSENASILDSHHVLRLTNNSYGMHGRALLRWAWNSFHNDALQISHGAVGTVYLGLLNPSSNGKSYNHLFAVEFDTIKNVEFEDIDDNHVGVDLNNLKSEEAQSAGYWDNGNEFRKLSLKSGQNIQAWIDYDHLQNQLNVSITFVATGNFVQDHYILAWSFTTSGTTPPPLDLSHLPSFAPSKSKSDSRGFIAGLTVASVVLLFLVIISLFHWLKKKKNREFIEEWELKYWPHRFSYKELSIATKRFRDEEVLGFGGIGKVYKGVLPSSGLHVAVKCITREFTEGMKGFIAEISSMGRLQHRNLVQLRGWCRKKRMLFIVYDYMPNGSLDRMIFGNPKTVLQWAQRYRILKDVAAGLLYLHEEWEQMVIHRDIKSSNVLLDSEFNGRTLGYIAPELIHTGKATPSADLFSFGVLMLEVACGRKPIDPSKGTAELVLADWVWELYAKEKLLDAVDPKLGGEYDVEEMERVLKLGLVCSHPEPEGRLSARQVLQILEGQSPLTILVKPSFNVSIMGNVPRSLYIRTPDLMSYGATSGSHSDRSSITR